MCWTATACKDLGLAKAEEQFWQCCLDKPHVLHLLGCSWGSFHLHQVWLDRGLSEGLARLWEGSPPLPWHRGLLVRRVSCPQAVTATPPQMQAATWPSLQGLRVSARLQPWFWDSGAAHGTCCPCCRKTASGGGQSSKKVRVSVPRELWMASLFTVAESVWAFLTHGVLRRPAGVGIAR